MLENWTIKQLSLVNTTKTCHTGIFVSCSDKDGNRRQSMTNIHKYSNERAWSIVNLKHLSTLAGTNSEIRGFTEAQAASKSFAIALCEIHRWKLFQHRSLWVSVDRLILQQQAYYPDHISSRCPRH